MPLIPKNTKIKDSDNSPYRNKIRFRLVQANAWCKQPLGASNRLVQATAWCKQTLGASKRLVQAAAWCKQPLGASNRLVQATAWCKQQSTKKGRFSPAFFNSDH
jgi:hypothetical protein